MRGRRLVTTDRVVAIVTDVDTDAVDRLRAWCDDTDVECTVHPVGADVAEGLGRTTRTVGVTIGGDGTFLEGVKAFAPRGVPILGIDLGTRAFLVRTAPADMERALDEVIAGDAVIDERSELRVRVDDLDATGLNDVLMRHAPPDRPVDRKVTSFDVFVDREYAGTFDGTGLVVSTPTGSTGIALSAGGPIHHPSHNETLQVTPLLIHDLSARPIVVDDSMPIAIRPTDTVELSIDGGRHFRTVDGGTVIRLERSTTPARLIRTSVDADHFQALADRLGWRPGAGDVPPPPPNVPATRPTNTLDQAREVAEEAARAVGGPLRELHGKTETIEYKSDKADIVTEADYQSQRIITAIIRSEFPDHSIRSEEDVHHEGEAGYTWLIDPLDGTGNYANGNPNYAVSIALVRDRRPVMGVVYAPETDELFSAVDGGPALRNGKPISTTDRDRLEESVFMSGYDPDGAFLTHFYQKTRGVRRLGSAALHLCYLAAGSCDATWEYDTLPWDTAAGVVIARAAGARLTDVHGEPFAAFGGDEHNELLGSNGPLHDAILAHLRHHGELGEL